MSTLQIKPQTHSFTNDELKTAFEHLIDIDASKSHFPHRFCKLYTSANPFEGSGLEVIYEDPGCNYHPNTDMPTDFIANHPLFTGGYYLGDVPTELFASRLRPAILFGLFYPANDTMPNAFYVFNTGLELQPNALVSFRRDPHNSDLTHFVNKITSVSLFHNTVTIDDDHVKDYIVFPTKRMAFTKSGNVKRGASEIVQQLIKDTLAHKTQQFTHTCTVDDLNYWDAWVIDENGIPLEPTSQIRQDPLRPNVSVKTWNNLHKSYLCAACQRHPNGTIEITCRRVSPGPLTRMQYLRLDHIRAVLFKEIYAPDLTVEWKQDEE